MTQKKRSIANIDVLILAMLKVKVCKVPFSCSRGSSHDKWPPDTIFSLVWTINSPTSPLSA